MSDEEGMLQREDLVESDTALEASANEVIAPVKSEERVPHRVYIENDQRVTYTHQGSRIIFGTSR